MPDEAIVRDDANFEKTVDLFETYFKNGGVHFQLSYVSREEMLAAKETPENYGHLRVRVPVIGGYKDTEAEMEKIAALLKPLWIRSVELLPYHAMGEHKYEAIGREGQTFTVPDADTMASFRGLFK